MVLSLASEQQEPYQGLMGTSVSKVGELLEFWAGMHFTSASRDSQHAKKTLGSSFVSVSCCHCAPIFWSRQSGAFSEGQVMWYKMADEVLTFALS